MTFSDGSLYVYKMDTEVRIIDIGILFLYPIIKVKCMLTVLKKQSTPSRVSSTSQWLMSLGDWEYFMTLRNGGFSSVDGLRSKIEWFWRDNQIEKLFFVIEKDDQFNNYHCHVLFSGPGWKSLDRKSLKGLNVHFEPVRDQVGSTVYVSKYLGTRIGPDYDLLIR